MTIVADQARLLVKLRAANEDAQAIRRRGYCGTASKDYEKAHEDIDYYLTRLGY